MTNNEKRELLTKAAKAVGLEGFIYDYAWQCLIADNPIDFFNPIDDNRDAFDLMIRINELNVLHILSCCGDSDLYKRDKAAAIRMAITRYAAEGYGKCASE